MKNSIVIGLMALMVGCTATQPIRYTAPTPEKQRQLDKAIAKCEYQIAMAPQQADWAYRGSLFEGANIEQRNQERLRLCLRADGWLPN